MTAEPDHGELNGRDVVVVGASTGGVEALQELVADLPRGASDSAFIVLRLPADGDAVARHWQDASVRDVRRTLRDIEERRRTEDEIRGRNVVLEQRVEEQTAKLISARARLDTVVAQMPSGVVIADAASGRIVLANDAASELLGAPIDPSSTVDQYEQLPLARSIAHGEAVSGELVEIVRPDETRIVIELSSSPVRDEEGEITAGVAVFFDVTARERKERAERDFVTNAAHELQTPLAGIVSAVEILQSGAKDDPAERERFLSHIERESGRLTRLVRALLVLAQSEMGVAAPRSELIELAPLLGRTAAELNLASGVRVEIECANDLALLSNRELVAQLLSNLGENAAKFTRRGRIVLRARQSTDGIVTLEVEDTGPGIQRDGRERVFERFYRSSMSEARGAGLGLAIVKAAAEALDGTLELRSTPGKGTTVSVALRGATLVR